MQNLPHFYHPKTPIELLKLNSSEREFQHRLGLEPQMMSNLKASQQKLAARGIQMTLEEVYAFEVETEPEED
jgi:hypothetical protein